MRKLQRQLKILCERNRDGGDKTQHQRARILSQIADQLWQMGFRELEYDQLGGRHVNRLLKRWEEEDLSPGTIKNRMAVLRWWAQKIGRGHILSKSNDDYDIPRRQYVTNISKGIQLAHESLAKITCPYVKLSLMLQRDFGLRKEEAICFAPSYAWNPEQDPNWIHLKPWWTKGGRPRSVPVRTEAQRETLTAVSALCGRGSLIPEGKKIEDQRGRYDAQTRQAGLSKLHGLRHAYAQQRFFDLKGEPCPVLGGKRRRDMTKEERAADDAVRLDISEELGHSRVDITNIYLGS
ncbi:MAG: integrase domain-containing protein [Candidatus Tectomicrobia bacterium]|nr:integrase domain-containing protein [Candidatus Tectomicrobia bacterium]